jgi:hypothetical protein
VKVFAALVHGLVGAALWLQSAVAVAGPPLISDDPNTVGPGVAQPIFSMIVSNRGSRTTLRAPLLDLTVGLVESLDVTLIASFDATYDASMRPRWELFGVLTPGIKWEFFETARGSLCLSPAFSYNTLAPERVGLLLPLQGELAVGDVDAVIGFDVGYLPFFKGSDEWFAIIYGRTAVTRRLKVLGELWAIGSAPNVAVTFGLSVGATYRIVGDELVLIASVSPAFASVSSRLLDLRGYFGLQYTYERPLIR